MSIEGKAWFPYLPMTAPIDVSVLAPLLAPTNFNGTARGLLVEVVNLDETNPVTVFVTASPSFPTVQVQLQISIYVVQKHRFF